MQALNATSVSFASGRQLLSGPRITPLRRSRTVKAPRKRTQLLVLSKHRSSSQYSAGLGFGDNGNNGPNGPGDCGRCWRFGGDDGNGRGANISISSGVAVLLAAAGAVTAVQAGPVGAFEAPGSEDGFALLDMFSEDVAAAAELTPGFSTVPGAYNPSAFNEEEKDLVCPRQYRVREWVYVH